ncbi:internal scaffolding protein [Microviridae sp.]|nr:internal scaffolding protein [Microviridae sp.]
MQFRTAYGKRNPVGLSTGPGLTKQSHKNECDINQIMARYQKTGVLEHAKAHQGSYGEITSETFLSAHQTIARAKSMFETLPSSLRERFENRPENYFDFVQDPDNTTELVKMGLVREEAKKQDDTSLLTSAPREGSKTSRTDVNPKESSVSDDSPKEKN